MTPPLARRIGWWGVQDPPPSQADRLVGGQLKKYVTLPLVAVL